MFRSRKLIRQAGFTMIELLVVIAVIGVLAVAVLSSINPIEQINKGRDTRTRSDAAQLINATDRFFAVHEIYPWNDASYNTSLGGGSDQLHSEALPGGGNCSATDGMCVLNTAPNSSWLDGLVDTAEVKPGFATRIRAINAPSELRMFKAAGSNNTVFVCFQPTSQAFQNEALSRCETDGATLPGRACQQGTYNASTTYVDELICLP